MNNWIGTIVVLIILLAGTYATSLPYEVEAVINSSVYKATMIFIILIAKFVNSTIAIVLAIILITFVRVYSDKLKENSQINRTGLSEEEYKQYMQELKMD